MEGSMNIVPTQVAVAGRAEGPLVISPAPLSFWGGWDAATGEVIDRRHPLSGRRLAGCVIALPWTRGSSTTTAVLLESVRRGTAPAAILLPKTDMFIALASVVAEELYGRGFPIVVVDAAQLVDGRTVRVTEAGLEVDGAE
jgi:predicted aconitase with swiveling domain